MSQREAILRRSHNLRLFGTLVSLVFSVLVFRCIPVETANENRTPILVMICYIGMSTLHLMNWIYMDERLFKAKGTFE